jgi:serine/threonine protein phosphatase PrpC
MRIKYASLSVSGPVRPHNEDAISFWMPRNAADWRSRGAVAILADGVGGQDRGEVASNTAATVACKAFCNGKPSAAPGQLLFEMFNAANIAVFDANLKGRDGSGKMATTLTVSIFRHNEVHIGHVGDCRVYLIQQGRIRRLTNDHSYAGVQLKLGLITVEDALNSPLRSVLTRSLGPEPTVRADYHNVQVTSGDMVVQCCDGVWTQMNDGEILNLVSRMPPEDACREMVSLAERRGADDNLSVQIMQIEVVERLSYYRGIATYQKESATIMGTELEVGQTLDGRFRITDMVSKSGMASIYKADDLKDNSVVALKVPLMHFESDPGFFSRFQREQAIGKALNHPYILRVMDDPELKKSRPYMVMEYLEGQTLGHLMQSVKPMPQPDALKIASRICEALHYMHGHDVVHRDLKPDNIMICNDGAIRIMDFGIAKFEGQRRLTFGGFTPAMGTPDYMAPEQVKGKRGDPRTDIYSLGAILYEMVTGSVPFEGPNPFIIMNSRISGDPVAPRTKNPEITPQVEEIILHAMARNPQERYESAIAMKAELDNPSAVGVTGRAQRLVAPSLSTTRWRKFRLIVLPVLFVVLIFVIAWSIKHVRVQ